MIEPILIAALMAVCFMLGRAYEEGWGGGNGRGDGIGDVI